MPLLSVSSLTNQDLMVSHKGILLCFPQEALGL